MKKSSVPRVKGIFKRGKIFWLSCIENGRRIQRSLETSDYVEAVVRAREVRHTAPLEISEPLETEITNFMAQKVARNEWSPASVESKQHCLRLFAEHAGKQVVSAITTADVQGFYDSYAGKVADSTRESYIMTLRSFLGTLLAKKKIVDNVALRIVMARVNRKGRLVFCSRSEVETLLANAPDDSMRLILLCGFHAGMRKQEIIEARPSWFDVERRIITIAQTETFRPEDREARSVPMTTAFIDFLRGYGLPSPFMLHPAVKHGEWRYRYDFRRPFDRYMNSQNCSHVSPHVMRHTFASLHASAGTSIFKIAEWMGDDVRVVQRHYAKLAPDNGDIDKAFG
jgi:integrase